jgi:putative ABC transport system permease protein
MKSFRLLESTLSDCAHGVRIIRHNPLFAATVVTTLALGIGSSTAVFTLFNTVLLRALPLPEADRVVVLQSTDHRDGKAFTVAEGVFTDWRSRSASFESIAGFWDTSMILSGEGQPHRVNAVKATADFFPIAGLRVTMGRVFDTSTEQPGRDNLAVIDAGFWHREFGGRKDILGRRIILDDHPYTVIGILPSGFSLGSLRRTDVWVPLAPRPDARGGGAVVVVARLRSGVTHDAAQAEMNVIHSQVVGDHREDSPFGVLVRRAHDWVVAEARPALVALSSAVLLLLLICCVNIGNLLIARSASRQREFAIRASLGGGRARLTRQVLLENLLLATTGGLLGWSLAVAFVRAVPNLRGFSLPRLDEIQVDGRMLLIAVAVTATSALLFGLFPAWQGSHSRMYHLLGGGTRTGVSKRSELHIRRALVVAQLSLSLLLLCGAGLLLNSFIRLTRIDAGFSRANVLAVGVDLPYKQYDASRQLLFHRQLMEGIRALPGVQQVSATDYLPLQAVLFPYELSLPGSPPPPVNAMARNVEPGYFQVLGVPLLAGREFDPSDDARFPVPVVLNAEAARRLLGQGQAVGMHLATQYRSRNLLEVIGVAGDVRQLGLRQDPGPQLYLPMKYGSARYSIARVAPNAGDLEAAIRGIVFRLDPAVPAPDVSTVSTWFEYEVAKPRLYLLILGAFAVIGLLVAAIGIYGVVAFDVARRTPEFGLRMALGATRGDILWLVLSGGVWLITAGVGIGVCGGLLATRLLSSQLYEIRPNDPVTFASGCGLLVLVALLACYLASRRATALEPTVALRHD